MRVGGMCSALCSSPLLFGALVTAQLECIPPAGSPWCVGGQTCICSGCVCGGGGGDPAGKWARAVWGLWGCGWGGWGVRLRVVWATPCVGR
jgi:hypothetical protein